MPAMNTAKLLAKLINAYRASYVTAAKIGVSGGIRQAMLKAIVGSKYLAPSAPKYKIGKKGSKEMQDMIAGFLKTRGK